MFQIHSVKALGLLHENLALLPGIQQAVEDRAHALLTLQTLISDIEKKKDKVPCTSATEGRDTAVIYRMILYPVRIYSYPSLRASKTRS